MYGLTPCQMGLTGITSSYGTGRALFSQSQRLIKRTAAANWLGLWGILWTEHSIVHMEKVRGQGQRGGMTRPEEGKTEKERKKERSKKRLRRRTERKQIMKKKTRNKIHK